MKGPQNELLESIKFIKALGHDCVAMLITRLKPLQVAPDDFVFKSGVVFILQR